MHLFLAFVCFFTAIGTPPAAAALPELPITSPPVTLTSTRDGGRCPAEEILNPLRTTNRQEIAQLLSNTVAPLLDEYECCPCRSPGRWSRITYLNMTNPDRECPPDWNFITTPMRACGRSTVPATCDSAMFPSNDSRVCGRVNAYQLGLVDAFAASVGEDNHRAYLSGWSLSLTHGAPGSHQHIWSFPVALNELTPILHGSAPVLMLP